MNKDASSTKEYKPQEIEAFWQKKWSDDKTFTPSLWTDPKPYFNLMMFPYPSAEGLHVGNMYAFTGADVHGRFKRMNGYQVFEPIGLDGFGIHSENYALKVGRHPAEQAKISQKNFYRQLASTGNGYDWTRTLETYDPDYYRWTQWLFIQMFKSGLAYRKKAKVNWCPSDKTVLADEQVIDGKCERDGAVVEKRDLEQWFFKITDYSDRLLAGLDKIDWPEKVKIAQKLWIGKSKGARLKFKVDSQNRELEVFTTRPDTLYGATFMVISPEHPLVEEILSGADANISKRIIENIKQYVVEAKNKTEQDRTATDKEKTGVESGLLATNPVNGAKIPIWIADYVLMGYGTGAIMAVPAHDERDFAFAKKYNLPITEVIEPKGGSVAHHPRPTSSLKDSDAVARRGSPNRATPNLPFVGEGRIINSESWNGWEMPESIDKVIEWLKENKIGKEESNYHLRDWLISRQRYWGPPIPMIYCKKCEEEGKGEREDMPGWYSAPLDQLPVLLPDVTDWKPMGSGESPLASHPEFYNTTCPSCSSVARRETDVSDTFLDSAWYYLRYLSIGDTKNMSKDIKTDKNGQEENDGSKVPYVPGIIKRWCPVAIYIGGAEHSVLHLLYVRFIAMVLHDLKNQPQNLALEFEEPFPRFFAHGLIVKDGAKMSKSKGNVVVPDAYINKFGADTLRLYLMFIGQFKDGGDFRDSGIEGTNRFVKRVWNLFNTVEFGPDSEETLRMINKTIKEVTNDIESFSYNTAIAKLMEFYNHISDDKKWSKETATSYLKLFAPFAPHMTEELWKNMELGEGSIHFSSWPEHQEKYLETNEVIVPIQINGKRRGEITVSSKDIKDQAKVEEKAKEIVSAQLEGKEVKKAIYVPGKIINFVV
ncbi:MAG TPA: leucine--tRNA ligase [Patescibacteria group bacterium]|nr:leucine--tRNA ligase [Patescibacteria group bacterium]